MSKKNVDIPAVELMREVGVRRLAGMDHCGCSSFRVHNADVDLSCCSGTNGTEPWLPWWRGWAMRISTDGFYDDLRHHEEVAREVFRQLSGGDGHWHAISGFLVRYGSSSTDYTGQCCYCEKAPRVHRSAYLCARCQKNREAPHYETLPMFLVTENYPDTAEELTDQARKEPPHAT